MQLEDLINKIKIPEEELRKYEETLLVFGTAGFYVNKEGNATNLSINELERIFKNEQK